MLVFKFGGASVRNAEAVRNVGQILQLFPHTKITMVVSAMGKTTNLLEEVAQAFCERNEDLFNQLVDRVSNYHAVIINELFTESNHPVFGEVTHEIERLKRWYVASVPENVSYLYDQIVSIGEILSTRIVENYLRQIGINSKWVDARKIIRTDASYQEGRVNWVKTEELVQRSLPEMLTKCDILVTQGFIGHTAEGFTTTLGREGSDYSAGILAYCLNAQSVTIWKDVPGMLNADPKFFENTTKLDQISFKEAIELSYYGASVIHPRTIQPLQKKNIPLYVKSFIHPLEPGTIIQTSTERDHLVASYIVKQNQLLVSLTTKDFSFVAEEHISDIFERLNRLGIKVNLMQNSALDFSFLVDRKKTSPEVIMTHLSDRYAVRYNEGLDLITIRHYNDSIIQELIRDKTILLEQKTRQTARLVVKPIQA